MRSIEEHEYALKTWWCCLENRGCDYGGKCSGCEYAHLEKGREEVREFFREEEEKRNKTI